MRRAIQNSRESLRTLAARYEVERMNRTIKEATVRTYHYDNHAELRAHIGSFLNADNLARRLKFYPG